jgi:uncharacterized protein (DUF305 family)
MIARRFRIPAAGAVISLALLAFVAGCASQWGHGMTRSIGSEYEFLVEMIPHHQEAVDSAGETAARTPRPECRDCRSADDEAHRMAVMMADRIVMETWLLEWYGIKSGGRMDH